MAILLERTGFFAAALLAGLIAAAPASAACDNPGDFPAWLDQFRQEAAAQGISPQALSALGSVGSVPIRRQPGLSALSGYVLTWFVGGA